MVTTSYFELILTLIILGVAGISCIFFPLKVIQIVSYWPRFLSTLFGKRIIGPKLRDTLDLMENDPLSFEQKYNLQLQILRVSGYIALGIVLLSLCMLTLSYL
jgi:hypothetical protein